MPCGSRVRPIETTDYAAWKSLWDGYNAFYSRAGATARADEITETMWQREIELLAFWHERRFADPVV